MRWRALSMLVCLICLCSSCEKDQLIPTTDEKFGIDPQLQPYFDRFVQEGANRDVPFDLNQLGVTAEIIEINENHVAGQCQYGSGVDPHITIDANFWNNASELAKELIVFHELGHCVLKRGHDEEKLNNGICGSIMRSGNGSCNDNYRWSTREYYLDELFFDF